MTKREQLWEKIKNNINTEYASDSRIAYLGKAVISCDECPYECKSELLRGKSCFANLYAYLKEHGDEEVEE